MSESRCCSSLSRSRFWSYSLWLAFLCCSKRSLLWQSWQSCLSGHIGFCSRWRPKGTFIRTSVSMLVGHFLLFVSPIFFAFAAGAVIWQPRLAHGCALLGFVAVPSAYWNLKDSGLGNVWVLFNQPNGRFNSYPPGLVLGIPFVGLLAVSLGISVLRLLPSGWTLRKILASDRTWPAVAASLVFISSGFAS